MIQKFIDGIAITSGCGIEFMDDEGLVVAGTVTERIGCLDENVLELVRRSRESCESAPDASYDSDSPDSRLVPIFCRSILVGIARLSGPPECVQSIEWLVRSTLELMYARQFSIRQIHSLPDQQTSLLYRLLNLKDENETFTVVQWGLMLGYDLTIPRVVCLFGARAGSIETQSGGRVSRDVVGNRLIGTITTSPLHSRQDIVSDNDVYGVIVLKTICSIDPEEYQRELRAYLLSIVPKASDVYGMPLMCAVGSHHGQLIELKESFAEAQAMMDLAQSAGGDPGREEPGFFVHDHLFEYLFTRLPEQYLDKIIGPIGDAVGGDTDLIATIEQLVGSGMNAVQAAGKLGIHKNTLMYRLEKLKASFGINPFYSDNDRILLRLLLRYLRRRRYLKVGIVVQQGTALHEGCIRFGELVARMTDSMINIMVHPMSALGGNSELAREVQNGTIDLAVSGISMISQLRDGESSLFDLPYLFETEQEAEEVLDGPIGAGLFEEIRKLGIVVLAVWTQGWRNISTRNVPARTPGDLTGLKIRVLPIRQMKDFVSLLGAVPVTMPYKDVYTGLQQHIIDGQDNAYGNFYKMRFHEVQQYIVETRHFYDPVLLTISEITWNKLSGESRRQLVTAAREITTWQRARAQAINDECKQRILQTGKTRILELTAGEREVFRKVARPLYDGFVDQELLRRVQKQLGRL